MEVKFNHVFYVYNEKTPLSKMVLGDINTTFKEGKITGIMGKSGSGKTTLIELINALIIPTKGNIQVGSRVISKTRKIQNINSLRYKIGLVFQVPEEQFFCKTVKEEIEFGMKCFKKSVKSIEKHVSDALIMMGLDDSYLNRNPFTLSSGEMRKVAIASVLAFNPKIVILDEPTIGLDNKSKENLIKIIKLLKNRYKKTIIVVSNDTDLLLKISDNVILLDKGKIILEGNKYDVFKQDISKYGLKRPKIIEFEQLVLEKKGIKIGYRDDINDLMKDVYRYVK